MDSIQNTIQEFKDSLDVPVMIDHRQVDKIVLNKLIAFRNAHSCSYVSQLDDIIKAYYITGEDFERHVTNKEPIE